MIYYTGIGSRETPTELLPIISQIVKYCELLKIILRSGGADGADSMFESYIRDPKLKEIYLPWKGFNLNQSPLYLPTQEAFDIAAKFHPAWNRLTIPVRKLMARNTHQILGQDCNTPSLFVICWTPKGEYKGGTSQAMRVADHSNIPIINLFDNNFEQVKTEIDKIWKK